MDHTLNSPHIVSRTRFTWGSLFWLATIQYFIVEVIAQRAWQAVPYSIRFNTISDLGITTCMQIPVLNLYACSPLHMLMNASFIVNGTLTILGAALLRPVFPRGWPTTFGLLLISIGSLGVIGVGFFPENQNYIFHMVNALTLFILTNFGLLVLGLSMYHAHWHRTYAVYTAALGVIGLVSLLLLPLGITPIVGIGLIERFVAYPLTIWVITSGVYFLAHRKILILPHIIKMSDAKVRT